MFTLYHKVIRLLAQNVNRYLTEQQQGNSKRDSKENEQCAQTSIAFDSNRQIDAICFRKFLTEIAIKHSYAYAYANANAMVVIDFSCVSIPK